MNTISKRRVLSSALVAEDKMTASIRQKTKGPHRSPKILVNSSKQSYSF
jgi:hypothetical protein